MPSHVLLTGANGFIAAHVLSILLEHGHTVVATVRSQEKAEKIKALHGNSDRLSFVIVKDIAVKGAFDDALKGKPPYDSVIHTASPFHFNVTDIQTQLLEPAITGTQAILTAIKTYAPSVKKVVITSSFAAIVDAEKGDWPGHTYDEGDWNPTTREFAILNPLNGYRASKTFAEKLAWDFIQKEKPNFSLSTLCPPMVFGPIFGNAGSLNLLNTSNERIRDIITGKYKNHIPDATSYLWVDVRDVALGHVRALEIKEAAGKRFLIAGGHFNNRLIVAIVRDHFPSLAHLLPAGDTPGGGYPIGGMYRYNNAQSKEVLGIQFRTLEESVVDTVKSLQSLKV